MSLATFAMLWLAVGFGVTSGVFATEIRDGGGPPQTWRDACLSISGMILMPFVWPVALYWIAKGRI